MSKKQPKARLDHFLLIRVICAHKYRLIKRVKIQSPEKLAWIRLYVCVQERRAKDWDSRGLAGPSPVRQTPREGTWCSWWKKKVINRMLLEPWCPGSLTISQHPLWPEKCFWSSGSSTPKSDPSRVAELGNLLLGAKMAMKIFVKRVFTIFATNALFLRVIPNLQI